MKIAGIDYGSKLAGTTAIAFIEKEKVCLAQSARKQDADRFILEWAQSWKPTHLFLDAPLSLPGVYRKMEQYQDFFYRKGDRQLKAMSPMFLGGLTARAMQLKEQLQATGVEVMEVYPAHLAKMLHLSREQYKKSKEHLPALAKLVVPLLPYPMQQEPLTSWHQFDSLLALASGYRYTQGQHLVFGDKAEGLIIV
ncbi:MAG: DUF429 domain-containing protein [Lewinellaceae bacterium]|nr:DUF429 domain-containing protein [Phaeodactylibacter sp.]MCB0612422.1 DUF429 domain-containing protein [Phaeodactylibacter sp.]MCB9349404.1 DUF429 domain-containing protein [Lewinellaceae bacterium]